MLAEVEKESLPEELRDLSEEELKKKVAELAAQRKKISAELNKLGEERAKFVDAERARLVAEGAEATLGEALNDSFRAIAAEKGYEVVVSEKRLKKLPAQRWKKRRQPTGKPPKRKRKIPASTRAHFSD